MKKMTLALLAGLSAVTALAGPALAQPYGGPPPPPGAYRPDLDRSEMNRGDPNRGPDYRDGDRRDGDHRDWDRHDGDRQDGYRQNVGQDQWNLDRRIQWTQERLNRGRQNGTLRAREFYRVQTDLNKIRAEEAGTLRYKGFVPPRTMANLQAHLDRLNAQIHWMRPNDDRRPW